MTVLAVSTGEAVLAFVGLALGLAVLALVIGLLNRVMRNAREIDRYADHILDAGLGIASNLDDADQIARTRDLGAAVPGLGVAYIRKLTGGAP